jgi:hypothetical protein
MTGVYSEIVASLLQRGLSDEAELWAATFLGCQIELATVAVGRMNEAVQGATQAMRKFNEALSATAD